jgi:hypothetical protein
VLRQSSPDATIRASVTQMVMNRRAFVTGLGAVLAAPLAEAAGAN